MLYRQLAYLPDRRSTRIEQSVHITIRGLSASRTPYEEKAATLSVNCHGCRYLSRNNVLRGDIATLEVGQLSDGRPRYSTQARVMSVKRLGPDEELFDVAVELESPRNIWGIASPPEDWPPILEVAEPAGYARELHIVRVQNWDCRSQTLCIPCPRSWSRSWPVCANGWEPRSPKLRKRQPPRPGMTADP